MMLAARPRVGAGSSLGKPPRCPQPATRAAQRAKAVPQSEQGDVSKPSLDAAIDKLLRASVSMGTASALFASGASATISQQALALRADSPQLTQVAAEGSNILDNIKGAFTPEADPNATEPTELETAEPQRQSVKQPSDPMAEPTALLSTPQQRPRLLSHLALGILEAPPLTQVSDAASDSAKGAAANVAKGALTDTAKGTASNSAKNFAIDAAKGAIKGRIKGASFAQASSSAGPVADTASAPQALGSFNVQPAIGDLSGGEPPAPSDPSGKADSAPVNPLQGVADIFNPNKVTSPDVGISSKGIENTSSNPPPAKPRPDIGDLSSGFYSVEDGKELRLRQAQSIRDNAQFSPQKRAGEESATPVSPQEGVRPELDGSQIVGGKTESTYRAAILGEPEPSKEPKGR